MSLSSSEDLHPKAGVRFVCIRLSQEGESPRYKMEAFLPEQKRQTSEVAWDESGDPAFSPDFETQEISDSAVKLARVLKSGKKIKITRWREIESE